ncbi:MAG: carbon starvation protein A [Bacteroidaceae bacterium]|nr:carbon starvation protein A [Bacteroidaceae bacterium]
MITFTIALFALIAGYFIYGKFVERVFGPDPSRVTPAITKADGVDYMVLPNWKIFMIQFLNIAGTGPIFGAIMGMWFGTSAYLWIVFGCIFAGATHDYLSGMLSLHHNGAGLPGLVGYYLGRRIKNVMLVFSVLLLIMVGAVFVYSPAIILQGIWGSQLLWIIAIFIYYIIATMLPVDKIIGKIYPLFAFSLIFMAVALMIGLFVKMPQLPELWDGMVNLGAEKFGRSEHIFPALFITIACGAISGFHATQSPLMARCMKSETMGRPIFYGSMITEGIVALIWATVSSYFFYAEGWREVCSPEVVQDVENALAQGGTLDKLFAAPKVVMSVCNGWLGVLGGVLALLGVVAAPITSGDTALRSARLIIAEYLKMDQRPIRNRLLICIPLFAVAMAMLIWQISDPNGFNTIWNYFGWANQSLSIFTLWTLAVYLARNNKNYLVAMIPALFMVVVCTTFILESKQGFGIEGPLPYFAGFAAAIGCVLLFFRWKRTRAQKYMNKKA